MSLVCSVIFIHHAFNANILDKDYAFSDGEILMVDNAVRTHFEPYERHFKEIGFNLHDTMIYEKNSLPMNHNRYEQEFEYMFIFSKGKPKTFNPIRIPCKYPEKETARQNSKYSYTDEKMRKARSNKQRKPVGQNKIKGNIWRYTTGHNHSTKDSIAFKHPAIFPEQLANDHIISWSNENDIVFDPFMGSGTTAKMAMLNNRRFIGCEISEEYCNIIKDRLGNV